MAEEKQDIVVEATPAAETSGQEFASGADIGGHHKRGGFTSKIGFVLAAAGSAVGLGNLWRFPYLAAKYGGGMFLLCYVLLAVTFGFSLLVLEIAIGRKTGKGVIGAFASLNKKFKWFGFICLVVPIIIIPYYSVIGGWVVRYIVAFLEGNGQLLGEAANAQTSAEFFSSKGIERISKILMPALAVLALFLMIYVLCQPGALAGVKKLFVPDFGDFTYETLLAALGQLFYSMSLAMCIMITYGSYMKKEASISASARQISVCDTLFAIVAALIIIPSIYAFSANPDSVASQSGPSLMFVQLPAVFNNIPGGRWIGAVFFVLVFFAALTSSISLAEAIVSVLRENCKLKRLPACAIVFGIMLVLGTLSSLGFGPLDMIQIDGKNLLDIFDYASNSILMPLVAIGTCIIAGYFYDLNIISDEIGLRKKGSRIYFRIMIRFVAPLCMFAILISGIFLNL